LNEGELAQSRLGGMGSIRGAKKRKRPEVYRRTFSFRATKSRLSEAKEYPRPTYQYIFQKCLLFIFAQEPICNRFLLFENHWYESQESSPPRRAGILLALRFRGKPRGIKPDVALTREGYKASFPFSRSVQ